MKTSKNTTIEDFIELDKDLYYNLKDGNLYKPKRKKPDQYHLYTIHINQHGYKRIYYRGRFLLVHQLIHYKLKIDCTNLVITLLDGNKQNTTPENMALMTRHESNFHHFHRRKLERLQQHNEN